MSTTNKYLEQKFPIECHGRDRMGNEVLVKAVTVSIKVYQSPGSNTISSIIECENNCGAHGEKCNASGREISHCPYSFDIPYARERKS